MVEVDFGKEPEIDKEVENSQSNLDLQRERVGLEQVGP